MSGVQKGPTVTRHEALDRWHTGTNYLIQANNAQRELFERYLQGLPGAGDHDEEGGEVPRT